MVCDEEAQYREIISISANQIVPPKFQGGTKMLYCIHQTPLSSCSVKGGSGYETAKHEHSMKLASFPGSPGTRIFIARRAWYLLYVSMTSAK